ncbi:MAG: hypothetical protein NVS2B9_00650 [Myxococcales bacterium]
MVRRNMAPPHQAPFVPREREKLKASPGVYATCAPEARPSVPRGCRAPAFLDFHGTTEATKDLR